jgi:hypothetical protein
MLQRLVTLHLKPYGKNAELVGVTKNKEFERTLSCLGDVSGLNADALDSFYNIRRENGEDLKHIMVCCVQAYHVFLLVFIAATWGVMFPTGAGEVVLTLGSLQDALKAYLETGDKKMWMLNSRQKVSSDVIVLVEITVALQLSGEFSRVEQPRHIELVTSTPQHVGRSGRSGSTKGVSDGVPQSSISTKSLSKRVNVAERL